MLNDLELERASFVGQNFATSYLFQYADHLAFNKDKAIKSHESFRFYNGLRHILDYIVKVWGKETNEDVKEIARSRIKKTFIAFRFFVIELKEYVEDFSKYQQELDKFSNFLYENGILAAENKK